MLPNQSGHEWKQLQGAILGQVDAIIIKTRKSEMEHCLNSIAYIYYVTIF